MIIFTKKDHEDITIMGHVLHYSGVFCDLRNGNALVDVADFCPGWDMRMDNNTCYLSEFFKDSLLNKLPDMPNWGYDEQDYQTALDSDDYVQKALLAMNGKYCDLLINDEIHDLRYYVALGILNDKKYGVVGDDAISILDRLVSADSHSTRWTIAQFGHKPHLDLLINDNFFAVREAIALHKHKEHLDILECDKDIMVRRAVAKSRRSTASDGSDEILSRDADHTVRTEVALRGDAAFLLSKDEHWQVRKAVAMNAEESLLSCSGLSIDPIAAVRIQVASRGVDLDLLVHDEDEYVRADVAKRGREQDLKLLVNDVSRIVRLEVAKKGYGLEALAKDTDPEVRKVATCHSVNFKKLFDEVC